MKDQKQVNKNRKTFLIVGIAILVAILTIGFWLKNILDTAQEKAREVANKEYSTYEFDVTIPEGWKRYENEPGDHDTLVYIEKDNGIANISIDNTQNYLDRPNSVAINQFTPQDILNERLLDIENTIKVDPNLDWQNFRIAEEVKEIDFKGFSAAEGDFIVDENILGEGKIVERRIKRIVIFTEDDLWNIVFAATNLNVFDLEEKEFDDFIEGLEVK